VYPELTSERVHQRWGGSKIASRKQIELTKESGGNEAEKAMAIMSAHLSTNTGDKIISERKTKGDYQYDCRATQRKSINGHVKKKRFWGKG